MSSILKALEKAEEAHSTRRNGGEGGLVRARKPRPSWITPAAVLGGAAVAVLVTFAAMGGFSRHAPAAQVPAVVAMTAPAVVAPYYPVTQMPAAKPAQAPSSEPTGASAVPKPRAKPLPTFPAKAGRAAKVPAPHPASGHPSPVHAAPVQASPLPEAAAAVAPAQTRQELRVTGIAWQNNGESSFAVVNGRAVTKGGTVDGFKVVEIHQDTVRFSGSGGSFDVPLGETNN